jgi:hypothetical protein
MRTEKMIAVSSLCVAVFSLLPGCGAGSPDGATYFINASIEGGGTASVSLDGEKTVEEDFNGRWSYQLNDVPGTVNAISIDVTPEKDDAPATCGISLSRSKEFAVNEEGTGTTTCVFRQSDFFDDAAADD